MEPLQPKVQTTSAEGVINVEIGLGAEEARLAHLVDPTTGAVQGLKLPEGNFDVMLAVKRGTEGPVVQRLIFTKRAGENRAVYKGKLRIPKNGSGNYEVAAVLVRQLQGATTGIVDGELLHSRATASFLRASDGVIASGLPYIADWTGVQLDAAEVRMQNFTMTFRPSGSLLRLKVKNELNKDVKLLGVRFRSNAIFFDWYYDFAQLRGGALREGSRRNTSEAVQDIYFSQVSMPTLATGATSSNWFYTWGMPSNATTGLNTEIRLLVEGDTPGSIIAVKSFTSSKAPDWGSSPLTLRLRQSEYDLALATPEVVAPRATGVLLQSNPMPNTPIPSLAQVDALGENIVISGVRDGVEQSFPNGAAGIRPLAVPLDKDVRIDGQLRSLSIVGGAVSTNPVVFRSLKQLSFAQLGDVLRHLSVEQLGLDALDLSGQTQLESLRLKDYKSLTSLDLSAMSLLKRIELGRYQQDAYQRSLAQIIWPSTNNVEELVMHQLSLSSVPFEQFGKLRKLELAGAGGGTSSYAQDLVFTAHPALESFMAFKISGFRNLRLENNLQLASVDYSGPGSMQQGELEIVIKGNPVLKSLKLYAPSNWAMPNNIVRIDLSNNPELNTVSRPSGERSLFASAVLRSVDLSGTPLSAESVRQIISELRQGDGVNTSIKLPEAHRATLATLATAKGWVVL